MVQCLVGDIKCSKTDGERDRDCTTHALKGWTSSLPATEKWQLAGKAEWGWEKMAGFSGLVATLSIISLIVSDKCIYVSYCR